MSDEPWGFHHILDYSGCNPELISSRENILSWIKELVPAIDMVAYGEPTLEHFATHSEKTAGFSLVQLIETSNICAHFAERIGEVKIDVFSCKEFKPDIVRHISHKYFEPKKVTRDNFFLR